jgi:hypothetical protein
MKRTILLSVIFILFAACSLGPYRPGTKVEIVCQEFCDTNVGSYVILYEEPGSDKVAGSAIDGVQMEILDSMIIDGVRYYQVKGGMVIGWLTEDHVQ